MTPLNQIEEVNMREIKLCQDNKDQGTPTDFQRIEITTEKGTLVITPNRDGSVGIRAYGELPYSAGKTGDMCIVAETTITGGLTVRIK